MIKESRPADTSPRPGKRPTIPSMPNRIRVKGIRKASSSRNFSLRNASSLKIPVPRPQRPDGTTTPPISGERGGMEIRVLALESGIDGLAARFGPVGSMLQSYRYGGDIFTEE